MQPHANGVVVRLPVLPLHAATLPLQFVASGGARPVGFVLMAQRFPAQGGRMGPC